MRMKFEPSSKTDHNHTKGDKRRDAAAWVNAKNRSKRWPVTNVPRVANAAYEPPKPVGSMDRLAPAENAG